MQCWSPDNSTPKRAKWAGKWVDGLSCHFAISRDFSNSVLRQGWIQDRLCVDTCSNVRPRLSLMKPGQI